MTPQPLTDDVIRAAIARRASGAAESDLRARVRAATATGRQRSSWLVRLELGQLIPQHRVGVTRWVVLALLVSAALVAAFVGYRAIDDTNPARSRPLAYISGGDLYVADADGASPRLVWDSPETEFLTESLTRPLWVDAETVLVQVRRTSDGVGLVYLLDTATSAPRLVDYGSELLALSPDHLRIATARAIAGAASRLQIVDIATGATVEIGSVESLTPLSWSPDDRWLLGEGSRFGSGGLIYRVDLETGRSSDVATGLCCSLHQPRPALSPDGSRVVFVDYYQAAAGEPCDVRCGTLWSLDPTTGARQQLTAREGSEIGPVFSPDGALIAFMEYTRTGYDVAVVRADGTDRRKLTESGDAFAPPANLEPYRYLFWDPDGTGLTYMRWPVGARDANGESELWHVTLDGQSEQRLGTFLVSEFAPMQPIGRTP